MVKKEKHVKNTQFCGRCREIKRECADCGVYFCEREDEKRYDDAGYMYDYLCWICHNQRASKQEGCSIS